MAMDILALVKPKIVMCKLTGSRGSEAGKRGQRPDRTTPLEGKAKNMVGQRTADEAPEDCTLHAEWATRESTAKSGGDKGRGRMEAAP